MKKYLFVALALTTTAAVATPAALTFPADYRSWAHAKSMVIGDKSHGLYGFHHVYVQPGALETYKKGGRHAEGAQMVVPFYEVVDDGKGTITQGPLKMVAVMRKDKSATDTGGWRYGAFGPDGKALALDVKANCYQCHTAKKDRDFVFSEWR